MSQKTTEYVKEIVGRRGHDRSVRETRAWSENNQNSLKTCMKLSNTKSNKPF